MKKLAILILLAIFNFSAFAQCFGPTANYQERWQAVYSQYGFVSRGVNVITQYSCNIDKSLKMKKSTHFKYKKGIKSEAPVSSREYKYANGNLLLYKYMQKGNLKNEYELIYNDRGYYTSYKYLKKKNYHLGEDVEYNDSNKVLKLTRYNKKEEISQKELYVYNEQQKLTEKSFYSGKKEIARSGFKYEYYSDGQKKQAEYYRKGKLKSRWLYTCDDEGKKVQTDSVKVALVCSTTEYKHDSSYVRVNRTTDSKGRVSKYRWSYNKKRELISYEYVDHKEKIIRKYTQEFDDKGNRVKYTYYKKGGDKISRISEYKFNEDKKVIERSSKKGDGKLKSKVVYKFNSHGQLIEKTQFDSKNKMSERRAYTYDNHGNEVKHVVYNKKNIPVEEFSYSYTY